APGNGCVEERYHRNTVDRVGVPGIEAEPAKPEDGHPNPCQMEILRFIAHVPASKVQHTREGAHSRDRVDHDPAPEVEHAPLLEEAPAPHHVRHRVVDEELPADEEDEVGTELDPVREGPRDER